MLVAAALPNGVRESGPLDSVKRMGQTGGQEFCPDRKQTGTMVAARTRSARKWKPQAGN